jgi:hypothetical protein
VAGVDKTYLYRDNNINMRVVKKLGSFGNAELVSAVIDELLKKLYHSLFVDRIEFHASNKNHYYVDGKTAKIFVNSKDRRIKAGDKRAIRALIINQLFHVIVKQRGFESKFHFLEDIVAFQEAVRKGFGDDVFYLSYKELLGKKQLDSFDEFMKANALHMVFKGHEAEFLKNLLAQVNYPKSFDMKAGKILKRINSGLWNEENLKRIEKYLEQ